MGSGRIDSVSAKNNGVSTKCWEDFDKNKKYSQSFGRKYGGVSTKNENISRVSMEKLAEFWKKA